MLRPPTELREIEGFPGWSWRALGSDDLALAWPLAGLAGAAADPASWTRLAGRWLASAALEGGGLGAIVNPGGLLVGLERHRPRALGCGLALAIVWHCTLEVTPAPRCLEALVRAMSELARRTGCAVLELAGDCPGGARLAALAERLGLAERAGCFRRSIAVSAAE